MGTSHTQSLVKIITENLEAYNVDLHFFRENNHTVYYNDLLRAKNLPVESLEIKG